MTQPILKHKANAERVTAGVEPYSPTLTGTLKAALDIIDAAREYRHADEMSHRDPEAYILAQRKLDERLAEWDS